MAMITTVAFAGLSIGIDSWREVQKKSKTSMAAPQLSAFETTTGAGLPNGISIQGHREAVHSV